MVQDEGRGGGFDRSHTNLTSLASITHHLAETQIEAATTPGNGKNLFAVLGIFGSDMVVGFGHHYLRFPLLEVPTIDTIQYYRSLVDGPEPLRAVDKGHLSIIDTDLKSALADGLHFDTRNTYDFMQVGQGNNIGFAVRRPDLSQTADLLRRAGEVAVPNTVAWHMIRGVQAAFKI